MRNVSEFADVLHRVPPSADRVIVINVATEVVTSLALASALRHLDMPVLAINCTAQGVNKVFMDTLRDQWQFDLIEMPLALHGVTLDRVFRHLQCERLTILDSDAEVLNSDIVKRQRQALDDDKVYGSGFVHDATWLEGEQSVLRVEGRAIPMLYAERPWIPYAMFRRDVVADAIEHGSTFREVYGVGSGANGLVVPYDVLAEHPAVAIHGDTGAELHSWLVDSGYRFDGPSVNEAGPHVRHYHGVTRTALSPDMRNATPLDLVEGEVLERLRDAYPEYWDGFVQAIKNAQA